MSYPFLALDAPPSADTRHAATAHGPISVGAPGRHVERAEREAREDANLAAGATRAVGAGSRAVAEEPDTYRTCFERDRDRIKHSRPFRRLAGKCQVFVAPENDHLRTRLTHAIEVAQVAVSIARPVGLNVALTEAAAIGHDCGHGPAGHASEGALSPFVEGGYHHAVYGADVVLAPLNLCAETLDAIRNHSWNRPAPATPEGEVVAWADRIAYVCHDFEDAVAAGIVAAGDLPGEVRAILGSERRVQLGNLITAMIETITLTGTVALRAAEADALSAFRAFNYDHIYLRDESVAQAKSAAALITELCSYFIEHPERIGHGGRHLGAVPAGTALHSSASVPAGTTLEIPTPVPAGTNPKTPTPVPAGTNPKTSTPVPAGTTLEIPTPVPAGTEVNELAPSDRVADAVRYVSGMTDRYLLRCAVEELGWDPGKLPMGV